VDSAIALVGKPCRRRSRAARARGENLRLAEEFPNHSVLQGLFTWPVFHFFTASSGKISSKAGDRGEAHVAASNDGRDVRCLNE
jgi:hypothetical protein